VLVTGRVQLSFHFNNVAGSGSALLRLNYQLKEECSFFEILNGDVNLSLSSHDQGRLLSGHNKVMFRENMSLEKIKPVFFGCPFIVSYRVVTKLPNKGVV